MSDTGRLKEAHPGTGASGAGIAAVTLALTAFSWGFILVKLIGLPPAVLAFWRLLIGAVFLLVIAAFMRVPFPSRSGAVLAAGVAFGAHQLLFITSTSWTSVAIVTLIAASQPLVVAVLSHRVVGEKVAPSMIGCALFALAGVGVVVHANLGDASRSLAGDLLAVCNMLVFTAYFLAAKRARLEGAPTLTFTACALSIAWVVVCPALLLMPLQWPDNRQWGFLLLLALGSGNGHLLVNWAHSRVTAALSSMILAALPLLSTLWAHLVLGEPYTLQHVLGILLVVGAIEAARRAEMRRIRAALRTGTNRPLPAE